MDEDDAVGGEEGTGSEADGGGAQSVEILAGFLGHRQVIAEHEGRAFGQFDVPDVLSLFAQVEQRFGGSFLDEMLEGGFGDGDAFVYDPFFAKFESSADPQRVLNHFGDASLVKPVQRSQMAAVDGECPWRIRTAFENDVDGCGGADMVGGEEGIGDTGSDDFHMSRIRQVVERKVRGGGRLSGTQDKLSHTISGDHAMKLLVMALMGVVLVLSTSPVSCKEDDPTKTTGDSKTDRAMVKLQKKSKALKTCTAQISTTIRIEDQEITISGPGMFKGPGKMRVEKTLPDGSTQLVVNDGSYLWILDRSENMVSRINLSRVYKMTHIEADADQFDPLRPFRGVDWSTIRYVGTDTVSGVVHEAFEATPLPSLLSAQLPSPPTKVRLSIHPVDGLLRVARLYDAENIEIIVQVFSDVQGNRELDDKLFEFIVPAGAHPMDATNETIDFFQSIQ